MIYEYFNVCSCSLCVLAWKWLFQLLYKKSKKAVMKAKKKKKHLSHFESYVSIYFTRNASSKTSCRRALRLHDVRKRSTARKSVFASWRV